jgi:hypothetical protein
MYEALHATLQERWKFPCGHFALSIHRLSCRQPDLYWIDTEPVPHRPQDAVAACSIAGAGRKAGGWLMESGREVDCRVPFDEERIARRCQFAGDTVTIEGDAEFLPIELAVCMNKQLHQRLLPAPAGQWMFTRLVLEGFLPPAGSARLTISLRENLYGRLTRSEIRAGSEALGSIYFSLVNR